MDSEALAKLFHETYERLAPDYGYATRPETARSWEEIPEDSPNKRLMMAVAGEVLEKLRPDSNHARYELEEIGGRIILARRWFSPLGAHLGVVAARTGMHAPEQGEWMAYIGTVGGWNEREDARWVAQYGAKLDPQEAAGFFPRLDISKYKGE